MSDSLQIEKLGPKHSLDGFHCGREELNRFLTRFALANQQAGAAQNYVAVSGESVVGYYSLAVGEVACDGAPDSLKKGLARHPVPIILIIGAQYLVRDWPVPALAKFPLIVVVVTAFLLWTYQSLVRYTWPGRFLNGPRTRPVPASSLEPAA